MQQLPKELISIQDFLSKYDFTLSNINQDWRINSSINEGKIVNIINTHFDIIIPRGRERFDFAIQTGDPTEFFPVNIKISDTTNYDNLNCKLWIYYALTGRLPNFPNETSRENFLTNLKKNLNDNNSDYYFLVINKKNLSDIILNSLKWLKSITPNWNNLPFQCKRNENRNYIKRNFNEAKNFILTTFWTSIQKRASIFLTFKELFNEYIK